MMEEFYIFYTKKEEGGGEGGLSEWVSEKRFQWF
jgi:hypothetical protein